MIVSFGQFIKTADLPLLHAAHSKDVEPSMVYVRQPVVDIMALLDAKGGRGFWLKGAPGTGKSQTGRLWATTQAQKGKAVVYGEVRGIRFWITEFILGKGWEQWRFDTFESFTKALLSASERENTVVVFDGAAGVKKSVHANLAGSLLQLGGVVFSSGQLECQDHTFDAEMPGWRLSEVISAIENEEFFATTQLAPEFEGDVNANADANANANADADADADANAKDLRHAFVAKKYDTTGGSARLMFEYTTKGAVDMLDEALANLSADDKKQVLFGDLKPSNHKSKNILTQGFCTGGGNSYDRRNVQHVFTSKHVLTALRASVTLKDVKRLYQQCKQLHRIIEGWAFEELVLRFFERDEKEVDAVVTLRMREESKAGGESKEEKWATVPSTTFNTKAFFGRGQLLDPANETIQLLDELLLRPDVTNNESWDAVLIKKEGQEFQLIFLEATLQETHSLSEMALVKAHGLLDALLTVLPEVSVSLQVRHDMIYISI